MPLSFMPQTDPGLDERVAWKLGWEPRVEWIISADGGESMRMFFATEGEAYYWLKEKQAQGLCCDCEVVCWYSWPPISTSIEWAWKALEQVATPNCWARVSGPHSVNDQTLWDCVIQSWSRGEGATAAEAIARAIDAALPEVEG